MILIDTSALYALADAGDAHHHEAVAIQRKLIEQGEVLLLHNYVAVETAALLQSRSGHEAANNFLRMDKEFVYEWVDEELHQEAVALFARLHSAKISFVDCVSFVVMRRRKIATAFAFDRHFVQQGFKLAA